MSNDPTPRRRLIKAKRPAHDRLREPVSQGPGNGAGNYTVAEILLLTELMQARSDPDKYLIPCLKRVHKHEMKKMKELRYTHDYYDYQENYDVGLLGPVLEMLGIARSHTPRSDDDERCDESGPRFWLHDWACDMALARRGCPADARYKLAKWRLRNCEQVRRVIHVWKREEV